MLGLGLNLIKNTYVPKIPIKLVDGSILPLLNQSISITRSGLAISPLQSYSYTSGTVVNNDTLVTLNQNNRLIPFIGGDTASLNFDFGLKVANSVAETPMKLYKSQIDVANPPIPTDASWVEVTLQSDLDKLKTQDLISLTINTQNTKASAFLVEVDLTTICTALYGGSNAALKSALKILQFDMWASGYGANGNDVVNGVGFSIYNQTSFKGSISNWGNAYNNLISQISHVATYWDTSVFPSNPPINSSNKIYILITSMYNSTVDIPASVSLDYLNIRVDLSRANDIITPMPITL